jgi:hypothetical protein
MPPLPKNTTEAQNLPTVQEAVVTSLQPEVAATVSEPESALRRFDPSKTVIPDIRTILSQHDQVIPYQAESHPMIHVAWIDDRGLSVARAAKFQPVRRDDLVEHHEPLQMHEIRVSGGISTLNFDGNGVVKNPDGHYLMFVDKRIYERYQQERLMQAREVMAESATSDPAIEIMRNHKKDKIADMMEGSSKHQVSTGDVRNEFEVG